MAVCRSKAIIISFKAAERRNSTPRVAVIVPIGWSFAAVGVPATGVRNLVHRLLGYSSFPQNPPKIELDGC